MQRHQPLEIAPEAGEAYEVLPGRADVGLVVLCDHASNEMPTEYGTLGLPRAQLARHIAYDIGARQIALEVGAAMGAPVVMSRFSRLLIDPNRGEDDPTLIMRLSDGAIVPGNRAIDAAERERRIARHYRPYHGAISRVLDACSASGIAPAILSIHSFTESWKGVPRPWHVGILWSDDERFARPLLDAFYASGDLLVGDNMPYSGGLMGDTLWQHATSRGLASAIVEVRQDLIRDAAGQSGWAARLITITRRLLPDLKALGTACMEQRSRS